MPARAFVAVALVVISCGLSVATAPTPAPSVTRAATFAPTVMVSGACTGPTATTVQILERLFALSTSNDFRAVSDCYTAAYRARNPSSFAEASETWSHDGPATNLVIKYIDAVNGCDRFHASAQMSGTSWWMRGQGNGSQFFTVGPDLGGPRIYETGTALVAREHATTRCP